MEHIVCYLVLILIVNIIIYISVAVVYIYWVVKYNKRKECVCCGKLLRRYKHKYYVSDAGQLCKKCFKSIYN